MGRSILSQVVSHVCHPLPLEPLRVSLKDLARQTRRTAPSRWCSDTAPGAAWRPGCALLAMVMRIHAHGTLSSGAVTIHGALSTGAATIFP